ncbi:MAG: hypothetical protein OES15_03635 [Nitrosopumilus sp.]|nr:hypothetical protein [Nitrosopumilus sp.]
MELVPINTKPILGLTLAAAFAIAMISNPVYAASPHLILTSMGMDENDDPYVTVRGTAGETQPEDAGDVLAIVLVTNAGAFAFASHDFCDDPDEQPDCPPGPDFTWHGHKILTKSVTEGNKTWETCLAFPNPEFADSTAVLSGDRYTLEDTGATKVHQALAVQMTTLDSGNICVVKVVSTLD